MSGAATPGGWRVSDFFPRWTPRAFIAWEDADGVNPLAGWNRYCDEIAWAPREDRVLVGASMRAEFEWEARR